MVTASPKWVFPGKSESILWTFTIIFAVIWMQKMDVGEGFLLEGWWIKIRDSWGWIHKPLQAQTKPSAICTVIALIKLSFTKSYFNVLSEILNSMLNTIKSKERGPTRASRNKWIWLTLTVSQLWGPNVIFLNLSNHTDQLNDLNPYF